MGCGGSKTPITYDEHAKDPAVAGDWELKAEAIRVFKLADLDSNGHLDSAEMAATMKKPQFVDTVMQNFDLNLDGKVSQSEFLIEIKKTFDKSAAAARTSLKTMEKVLLASKEK